MNLTVITPPPFEPVTLQKVYKQLRLDPDLVGSPAEASHPDDAMLLGQIAAAREFVEISTRRALVQQTLRLSCGSFPSHCAGWWRGRAHETVDKILLRRPPLQRVLSVAYYDGANQLQTLDPSQYFVTDTQVPELRFTNGFGSPSLYARPDALRVDYVVGYIPAGSPPATQEEYAAAVPKQLQQAVLIGVQLQYDNLSGPDRAAMEKMQEAILQSMRIQHTP